MRKNRILGCICCLAVMTVTAYCGELRIAENKSAVRESLLWERESLAEKAAEEASVRASEAAKEAKAAQIDEMLVGETRQAYQELFLALSNENYAAAANCLKEKSELLETFFKDVVENGSYLYDGTHFIEASEGYGLLVNAADVAYLGEWKEGKPDGMGVAFRAFVIDSPRYDMSKGEWSQGKMNGEGITGYCYYEGISEPYTKEIWKEGMFQDDKMEGELSYYSINVSGEKREWNLRALNGKTVLDERWVVSEDKAQYRIPAKTNQQYDYVLDAAKADAVLWKNMVEWK